MVNFFLGFFFLQNFDVHCYTVLVIADSGHVCDTCGDQKNYTLICLEMACCFSVWVWTELLILINVLPQLTQR